jgi:D-lactate dehydrogenase (cytochrome)
MDKILALHDDDLDVVVQPSIGWMKLNEDIKDSGLFFPVVGQTRRSQYFGRVC